MKHGYSDIMVKYTEKIIFVKNLIYEVSFKDQDNLYEKSIVVDSIKVRLLEQGQSTQLLKDEKNVAIGKSLQLARSLQYFERDFAELTIRLFIKRMGNLLPDIRKYPKIWYLMQLPPSFGGLHLGIHKNIYDLVNSSPRVIKQLISKMYSGCNIQEELRLLSNLNTNEICRSSKTYRDLEKYIITRLEEGTYPQVRSRTMTWTQVKALYPQAEDPRRVLSLAALDRIVSIEEFAKETSRPALFADLLVTQGARRQFVTVDYELRFRKIWDQLNELTEGFTFEEFNEINYPRLRERMTYPMQMLFLQIAPVSSIGAKYGFRLEYIGQSQPGLLVKSFLKEY
jgi:hypothetical protein